MKLKGSHIILLSVVFGVLVWFSVAMSDQYHLVVWAPLSIESVPAGKSVRTSVPPTLELKLRGSGWQVASLFWASELKLSFPYSMFNGQRRAITLTDVAELIGRRPGLQLIAMSPDSIFVELDRMAWRTIPVQLDCQMLFKDGYGQIGPAVVVPESVTIAGAESVIRTIDAWNTTHTIFENVKVPIDADIPLASSMLYMVSFSTPKVHIRINVEPFAEKTLGGIPVDAVSVAANRELILIPPRIDLVVRGGIRQLSLLTPDDLHVRVNYAAVLADSSGSVEAEVQAPSGVQIVARKPERLQYVVRKRM